MKVLGATDFEGEKINLEFDFSSRWAPTVYELLYKATTAFNNYFAVHGGRYTFYIRCAAVFDEARKEWKTLRPSTALAPNDQVYFFQVDVQESTGAIPTPTSAQPYLDLSHRYALQRNPLTRSTDIAAPSSSSVAKSPSSAKKSWHVATPPEREEGFAEVKEALRRIQSRRGERTSERPGRDTGTSAETAAKVSPPLVPDSAKSRFANLGAFARNDSLLREEREKFSRRMNLPIDDLRQAVRAESEELRLSLSQYNGLEK